MFWKLFLFFLKTFNLTLVLLNNIYKVVLANRQKRKKKRTSQGCSMFGTSGMCASCVAVLILDSRVYE